jgi:hypothetical protein
MVYGRPVTSPNPWRMDGDINLDDIFNGLLVERTSFSIKYPGLLI